MRSKILVIITTVLLFGVGFAVYAYNSTQSITETVAASCCSCCGDSCPMKAKATNANATGEAGHECCCKGGGASCPMKSKDGKSGDKMEPGMKHDMKMASGESCPMMKDGKAHEIHVGMKSADGKCGHSCSCCSHGKEKKDTTKTGAI